VEIQAIFDTVVTHLRTQGKKAVTTNCNGNEKCMYRALDRETGNVLKCAAGCLIPDEIYSTRMENQSIRDVLDDSSSLRDHLFGADYDGYTYNDPRSVLLKDLQRTHDSCDVSEWEERFKVLATVHNVQLN
jgi:hypothetical protein